MTVLIKVSDWIFEALAPLLATNDENIVDVDSLTAWLQTSHSANAAQPASPATATPANHSIITSAAFAHRDSDATSTTSSSESEDNSTVASFTAGTASPASTTSNTDDLYINLSDLQSTIPVSLEDLPTELLEGIYKPIINDSIGANPADRNEKLRRIDRVLTCAPSPILHAVAQTCFFDLVTYEATVQASFSSFKLTGSFAESGRFRIHGKRLKITLAITSPVLMVIAVNRVEQVILGCQRLISIAVVLDLGQTRLSDVQRVLLNQKVLTMARHYGRTEILEYSEV
ncbi:hypothetical protein B0A48_17311 [Cryoendolithus antarcticus]|uniref:Uncharacterized protein n=1 Tax=Cryoendolithus antarcticus TaxID=1507870 RepID=A0A1V8SCY5_9PEZI|nr:hypothetical protein B0A48_17311 [Cryoendolithus antarcticus]